MKQHKKTIVAINGELTAGKDTFCNFCIGTDHTELLIRSISSVDQIKDIARQLGWNGVKDDHSRQFLSDLKDLSTNYNDGPFLHILNQIHEEQNVLFVHIREIEEIEKLKQWVNYMNDNSSDTDPQRLAFKSIKVVRKSVQSLSNNTGDLGSQQQYDYDEYIMNDGTLEELRLKAIKFVSNICDAYQKM